VFLQALRQALGAKAHITTCSTQRAFIGPDGSPITDVSAFAAVLDGVLVMNYDVWGGELTQ
jgi:chitinase